MAHVSRAPALTWMNVPAGAVACPAPFAPQHLTVPSDLMAQVWYEPALICVKVPVGMLFCCPVALLPQQAIVPSVRMPQMCAKPAEMLVIWPSAMLGVATVTPGTDPNIASTITIAVIRLIPRRRRRCEVMLWSIALRSLLRCRCRSAATVHRRQGIKVETVISSGQ